MQRYIENPQSLARALRQALESKRMKADTLLFPVTINYDLSLEAMIAAGKYDWKNDDITAQHFPIKGEGAVDIEVQLVYFDRAMQSDDIIRELDRRGLRPAKIEELFAFGAKYPDVQREFPVVALGSFWRYAEGCRFVTCLDMGGSNRYLYLFWFEGGWGGGCRFAAISKEAAKLPRAV